MEFLGKKTSIFIFHYVLLFENPSVPLNINLLSLALCHCKTSNFFNFPPSKDRSGVTSTDNNLPQYFPKRQKQNLILVIAKKWNAEFSKYVLSPLSVTPSKPTFTFFLSIVSLWKNITTDQVESILPINQMAIFVFVTIAPAPVILCYFCFLNVGSLTQVSNQGFLLGISNKARECAEGKPE